MSGLTALVVGLSITAVVVVSWLGSILYVRRTRAALPAEAVATPADLARDDERAHSIEAWLAHAATLPDGQPPVMAFAEREQARLEALAKRHFPHLADKHPHLHLMGITGVEKRLLAWVSQHTGLPNPFDALERLTGDPDTLSRATEIWQHSHSDLVAVVDELSKATARLYADRAGADSEAFFTAVAEYLTELEALAADVKATGETLRGLQAEAALAESTVTGLVNLLIGSLGGFLVESVLTVGTLTPAVAAQAQLELSWVIKQVAMALARLGGIYTNARHILQSVTGFTDLIRTSPHFQPGEIESIGRTLGAR
jgi:hypothetical protein